MVGICRLCAALRKADALITITDVSHEVCQKLRQCCQVEIRLEDTLPKCVCLDCVQALRQAHSFYSKVHESQESLSLVFKPEVIQSSDVSTAVGRLPTLAESLTSSVVSKSEIEMVTVVADEEEKISEESQASTIEDDHDDEVIDDEVYLIEQMLGRKLSGSNKEINEDTVKIAENLHLNKSQEVVEPSMESLTETTTEMEEVLDLKLDSQNVLEVPDEPVQPVPTSDHASTQETWNSYPWRCYLCDAEEPSFNDLVLHCHVTHDRQSFNDMHFKCVDCQKICTRYYNLVNHVRHRHRSALTLCCDVCNIFCSDFKELAQHRLENHASDLDFPRVLLCGECGHGFSTQNSLQIHSRMHSKRDKNYECGDCGKRFVYFSGWKIHQRVHADIREFSCEQCGKSFRQKVNLEAHMLTHIVDKPYQCTKCPKSFKTPTSLSKHDIIHTDIKKFQCDYCGNKFRSKDAKLSHERTHTGEMPYKCPHCTRSFRFRSTFLSHQNTHTGKRPYSCTACNHHFTNWPNYNKHMKRRHAADKTDVSSTAATKKRLKKKDASTKSVEVTELHFVYDDILEEETADSPEATVMDEDVVYAISTESIDSADIDATGIISISTLP